MRRRKKRKEVNVAECIKFINTLINKRSNDAGRSFFLDLGSLKSDLFHRFSIESVVASRANETHWAKRKGKEAKEERGKKRVHRLHSLLLCFPAPGIGLLVSEQTVEPEADAESSSLVCGGQSMFLYLFFCCSIALAVLPTSSHHRLSKSSMMRSRPFSNTVKSRHVRNSFDRANRLLSLALSSISRLSLCVCVYVCLGLWLVIAVIRKTYGNWQWAKQCKNSKTFAWPLFKIFFLSF